MRKLPPNLLSCNRAVTRPDIRQVYGALASKIIRQDLRTFVNT